LTLYGKDGIKAPIYRELHSMGGHTDEITSVAGRPDGRQLLQVEIPAPVPGKS